MLRNRTRVEWKILLDDDDWNSNRHPSIPDPEIGPSPSSTPMSTRRRRLLWAMTGLFCVCLCSVGYLLWRTAERSLAALEVELRDAIVLDSWISDTPRHLQSAPQTSPQSLSPSAQTAIVLQDFDLYGNVACTEVVVNDPALPLAYRETRAYRNTEMGWLRTSLPSDFWGSAQQYESEHFVFIFHFRDLPAVLESAPRLDANYTRLCRNLGLPEMLHGKMVVELNERSPSASVNLNIHERHLDLSSPSLLKIPGNLTDSDLLVQLVTVPLARHLLERATEDWLNNGEWRLDWSWEPALTGIHSWLIEDLGDPLAEYKEGIIGWNYRSRQVTAVNTADELLLPYNAICALCRLMPVESVQFVLPISCVEDCLNGASRCYALPMLPIDMEALGKPIFLPIMVTSQGNANPESPPKMRSAVLRASFLRRDLATFTLIQYIVDTYGSERIPELVHEMGNHRSWDTLIPVVFGLQAKEFETGWQVYLAERYGGE